MSTNRLPELPEKFKFLFPEGKMPNIDKFGRDDIYGWLDKVKAIEGGIPERHQADLLKHIWQTVDAWFAVSSGNIMDTSLPIWIGDYSRKFAESPDTAELSIELAQLLAR